MKTKSILPALALVIALSAPAFPAEKKPAADKPAEAAKAAEPKKETPVKRDTYPLYGVVVSATDNLLTIKGGDGKPDRKYTLTSGTKIHDGDKPAALKDLKEGAWVGGLLKKSTTGNDTVVSLNLGVKQKELKKTEVTKAAATTSSRRKKTS